MTTDTALQSAVRALIQDAEFIKAWSGEVKFVLAKALRTEGELPPFADKEVRWAMGEARAIERKCVRDIEAGEKTLSQADKRRLVGA